MSSRFAGYTPGFARGFILEVGGMVQLLVQIVWSAVRYPTGYWGAVVDDIQYRIRNSWLPLSLAIAGYCLFTSMTAMMFFKMVGGQQLFGPAMMLQYIRTFTVWINGVAVAGIVGAALTADIGSRKVREELDALVVMGVNPLRELAVPRVISLTLLTTMLSMPSQFITTIAAYGASAYVAHLSLSEFFFNLFINLHAVDVYGLIFNCFLVGVTVGAICCYKGFAAAGGAVGLGRAVNQAVVLSVVGIWVMQLPYQALMLGLFPDLGVWK